MEEDIDTRKINNSFLRDHSYATEGNASSTAFRRWGRVQVVDSCASPAARRLVAETLGALGLGRGLRLGSHPNCLGVWHSHPGSVTRAPVQQQVDQEPLGVKMAFRD